MKPRTKIGSAQAPDGTLLELYEHDGAHEITAGGHPLMSSRMHFSEEELARLACVDLPPRPVVMIGGLGIGFTLRAALDALPEDGRAVQIELSPEVVEWNRGPLGPHAGHPLDDPRVDLRRTDVTKAIKKANGTYAAMMLDVDNGPSPMVQAKNAGLYGHRGIESIRRALVPGGRIAIWSAQDDRSFVRRLSDHGFEVATHKVHARPRRKGTLYWVFVGKKV